MKVTSNFRKSNYNLSLF